MTDKERIDELEDEIIALKEEIKDWEASFWLYHRTSRAAQDLYLAKHPDFDADIPDGTATIQWLIEEYLRLELQHGN